MVPFGKLYGTRGTQSQAQVTSRWLADFEKAGCEVTRENPARLSVLVPGPDAQLVSSEGLFSLQRVFWDRMTVTVDADGTARFRLDYFSPAQLLMHAFVAAMCVLGAWSGLQNQLLDSRHFALTFAVAESVPFFITLIGFRLAREAALRRALET